jgi:hypothetical protein
MKKALFLLIPLYLIVLASCDNFMNGSNVQEQLTQMIDVANATSCTLIVSNDTTMGSFLSTGDKSCKLGYSIDVQYTVKKDQYIFKGLKAVDKNDNTKPLNDYVEFESIDSDDARGIYKVSIKLVKESNDILIVPECEPVPNIIEMTPEYDYEGKQQDTTITLKFNKPVSSVGEMEYIKTAISITDSDGESLSQYFGTPYFSADSTILYIPTIKTQRILTDVDEKKDIVVKFDLSGIKDENGNIGNGFYQNKYRINGTLDSIKPTLTAANIYTNKDKSKQLLATPFADWPASSADKTNYMANHVKDSVYVEIEGSDIGSGVARAHVTEKLIKYSDGTDAVTQTMEAAVEFIEQTDDGKYCLVYEIKSPMDGIVELTFNLEDFAGNLNKTSEAKKIYVLKDTLVETSLLHFNQELSQITISEESWLSVIPVVEGDTQTVKLTTSTDYTETFYPNCTSEYSVEAFWGYSKDAITNPVTVDKEKGEYTFTRDVSKFVYIKLIISDEIGNTSETIKYMDPRPEFNSVNALTLQNPQGNVELSLKGLNSIKLLANRKIAGAGSKGGGDDYKTYTQYIAYIYDSVDTDGKPVGEPTKKMYFPPAQHTVNASDGPSDDGNGLYDWRNIARFTDNNEIPFNKLIRIYASSFCGDFLSPMTTDYVEYMISSLDDYYWPVYAEGKAPKLYVTRDSADAYSKDMIYEYGPYIKETVKIKTTAIKNSGVYKVIIDDYKTDAAIAEGNVIYQFIAYGKQPVYHVEGLETPETEDDIEIFSCWSIMQTYSNDIPEFYLPAIDSYSFHIIATGKQGTYISIKSDNENPDIEQEQGISFYLDEATTTKNLLEFSGDISGPNVGTGGITDPFYYSKEPGSVEVPRPEDESGLYKNEKGNYELTYYLIPATGSSIQTGRNYTLEELEKNYSRYKRIIEYSDTEEEEEDDIPSPDVVNMSLPLGNEKGGVYNLAIVYEDIYRNANVVTFPCVNRIIGDLTITKDATVVSQYGYNDEFGNYHSLENPEAVPEGYNVVSTDRACQQLEFTLDDCDYVSIYEIGMSQRECWREIWSSTMYPDNRNIYVAWDDTPLSFQDGQGRPITDQWFKICGHKESDSAFEMGFYNTKYYYLTENPWVQCNSKNALPGLNGIQIYFDAPILVHTMYFKDFIPDDIDKTNYRDWERRGAETGVFTAKPTTQKEYQFDNSGSYLGSSEGTIPSSATYSFKENCKDIPSGCYYTTIIHFADGDVIMNDIQYKE